MNFQTNNNNITLNFCLLTGQKYPLECNTSEKLSQIINRLKQEKILNTQNVCLIANANQLDQEKTISELGIENNAMILIFPIMNNEDDESQENNDTNENIKKIKSEYQLDENEKKMVRKWMNEFKEKQLIEEAISKLKNQDKKILRNIDNNISYKDKYDYLEQKDELSGVEVKEHEHGLIYIISLLNWKCSCCKNINSKNVARYYCSLCDYNMCDKCYSKKKYSKKKNFQDLVVKPSNDKIKDPKLKSKYHKHNLIYCRSSRNFIGYNTWICDNCDKEFSNDIWSFICTFCDFDLCCECAKKKE